MIKIISPSKCIVIICSLAISFVSIAEDFNLSDEVSDPGAAFQADLLKRKKQNSIYDISAPSLSSFGGSLKLSVRDYVNFESKDSEICRANYQLGFDQYEIKQLSILENAATRAFACDNSVLFSGYDDCSCNQYESCAKAIFNLDDFRNFANTDHYKYIVLPYIAGDLATKMTKKQITNNLNKIEDAKLLRKFAEKKGYEIADSSKCENKEIELNCNTEELDSIIYEKQKNCGLSSGINCHNLDDKDFTDIANYDSKKQIKYDIYLDKISESNAIEILTNEQSIEKDLIDFLISKGINKIKKGSKQALNVEKELKEKLIEIKSKNKLDPIWNMFFNDSKKISKLTNGIIEASKKAKGSMFANIKDNITKIKKDEVQAFFSTEECTNIPTLQKICNSKEGILSSNKRNMSNLTDDELKEFFTDEDLMGDYDKFLNNSLSRTIKNVNEYSALIKGYRCFMFRYTFEDKSKSKKENKSFCGIGYNQPSSEGESFFGGYKREFISTSNEENNGGPKGNPEKADSSVSISSLNVETQKLEDKNLVDKYEAANELNLNKVMTDTMNNNFGNNFTPEGPIAINNHNEFNQPISSEPTDAESRSEKSPAAILEEKLRELTNKISAAEQSLDKLKSGKKEDDVKAVAGQSQDEMAKALEAQIKQLRSELASAKAKAPAIVEKAEPAIGRNIASVPSAAISASRDSSEDRRTFANDSTKKNEAGREATRAYGESTTTSPSAGTNGNSNQASSSQSRVGGLVLTKVDGLSSDAAIETISAKITEIAGQPFLIEEGGFVKEIIPVIKDGKIVLDSKGKPIFEKIIKGKVADLKHKNSKRAPAAISSQAELRKIEEAKVKTESERLKYKNLRELTDEAVK